MTYTSATGPGSSKTYDALGRLTSETSYGLKMSYAYDLAGGRTQVTWWDGVYVNYDYDLADEATAIRENGATSGVGVLARYSYDDLGRITQVTRGNNVTTAYGYDGISRLTSLTHTMSGGNVQNLTYGLSYSAASQLRTMTSSNLAYRWGAGVSATRAYVVNGQNQLTSSGGATIGYDARGNLSSDSVTTYGYDVRNLLVSASGGATASLSNDPEGRLQSLSSGGAVTNFVYAGANVAAEVNGASGANNAILRRYVPGLAEDQPVVWYEGSGLTDRRWLLEDHQGSVVAVTNGTGGALAINSYDDYGAPGSGNLGRYQYTGQLWLPEVGLYDYKARDYSPTLGRFMQTDPVGYKDGLNWYDYVHNDPTDRADMTGDCTQTKGQDYIECDYRSPEDEQGKGRSISNSQSVKVAQADSEENDDEPIGMGHNNPPPDARLPPPTLAIPADNAQLESNIDAWGHITHTASGYDIWGYAQKVDGAAVYNIGAIYKTTTSRGLPALANEFESTARKIGLRMVIINGAGVANAGFLNAATARRFGYSFSTLPGGSVRLVKVIP